MSNRAIVCGGREYDDPVGTLLLHLAVMRYDIAELAHGGAKGADQVARYYGRVYKFPVREYRADWDRYGKAAGPIRNERMLDDFEPDYLFAFPGGLGTADMIHRAEMAGVTVIQLGEHRVRPPRPEPKMVKGL